jgi:Tfp pilus assembly protein PilF
LQYAERAYQMARNDADIMDTYVVALLTKKNYEKAESLSRRAIQEKQFRNEPVTASFIFHLGESLAGQGRVEKAREQYEKALSILETKGEAVGETQLREKIERAMGKLDNSN